MSEEERLRMQLKCAESILRLAYAYSVATGDLHSGEDSRSYFASHRYEDRLNQALDLYNETFGWSKPKLDHWYEFSDSSPQ